MATPVFTVKADPENKLSPVASSTSLDPPSSPILETQVDKSKTNINWLGSSYSGADIKVVAHLYTDLAPYSSHILDEAKRYTEAADVLEEVASLIFFNISLAQSANALTQSFIWGRFQDSIRVRIAEHPDISDLIRPWLEEVIGLPYRAHPITNTRSTAVIQAMREQADQYRKMAAEYTDKTKASREIHEASSQTQVLGTLQTISTQTHRDKVPVRALGCSYVKGYCRGTRSIAGSMIFTTFNEHCLRQLIREMAHSQYARSEFDAFNTSLIPDQLPPIDLTISFANEYGSTSRMSIYGVEFLNDALTLSSEDILSESVLQFVARDIDVLTDTGNILLSQQERTINGIPYGDGKNLTGSDLLFTSKNSYDKYLTSLGLRNRLKSV